VQKGRGAIEEIRGEEIPTDEIKRRRERDSLLSSHEKIARIFLKRN